MILRTLLIGAALCGLCACGTRGDLERPPPGGSQTRGEIVDPAGTSRSISARPIAGTNDPVGRPPAP